MAAPRRVLFFAEAVTLAHVARPIVLANSLDPQRYEAIVACSPRYQRFLDSEPWQTVPLDSISSERFMAALASGSPVYDAQTLRHYVREDLTLIDRFKPDLVVGDFRLSLSVSCRLTGVPYATVTNVYWSPFMADQTLPVPVLPMTRFLPIAVAQTVFNLARPVAFAMHCRPLNRVRLENGLASLGNDLRRLYTDADHVLYADTPGMFETDPLPPTHRFLGPILWSPAVEVPVWWHSLPPDKPLVYATLGSSGGAAALLQVLDALRDLPVSVMASTAGRPVPAKYPSNAYVSEYLPGIEAAARAKMVICNGGSPTSHQALAAGVPLLGVTSNLDQFLNMAAIVQAGLGIQLRADRLTTRAISDAVRHMLDRPGFTQSASAFAADHSSNRAGEQFLSWVSEILDDRQQVGT